MKPLIVDKCYYGKQLSRTGRVDNSNKKDKYKRLTQNHIFFEIRFCNKKTKLNSNANCAICFTSVHCTQHKIVSNFKMYALWLATASGVSLQAHYIERCIGGIEIKECIRVHKNR